jgi:transcription termination/antitermination protein NusA
VVDDESYPIVLGKRGMNTRLCGQLVGIQLNVQRMSEYQANMNFQRAQLALVDDPTLDEPLVLHEVSQLAVQCLISAGYDTPKKVLNASPTELSSIPGISPELADKILEEIRLKRL